MADHPLSVLSPQQEGEGEVVYPIPQMVEVVEPVAVPQIAVLGVREPLVREMPVVIRMLPGVLEVVLQGVAVAADLLLLMAQTVEMAALPQSPELL